MGLRLIGENEELREAIRRELSGTGGAEPLRRTPGRKRPVATLATLSEKRRKLLELYYSDKISPDLFAEEEDRINQGIEAARSLAGSEDEADMRSKGLADGFEAVVAVLRDLDIDRIWAEATDAERRVLIEELVESVQMFPDHVEVKVAGTPRINVLFSEVGLKDKYVSGGVGGGT